MGGDMIDKKSIYLQLDENKVRRLKESIISNGLVAAMSESFRALSDPTRIRILIALEKAELCVYDIGSLVDLPQPTVSHHLKALRQLGLVQCRKSGKMTLYSIKDSRVFGLLAVARDFARNNVRP
jgi:DNA-binding transcriptional ArsR family regulator